MKILSEVGSKIRCLGFLRYDLVQTLKCPRRACPFHELEFRHDGSDFLLT